MKNTIEILQRLYQTRKKRKAQFSEKNGHCIGILTAGKTSFSEKSGLDYYTLRPVYAKDKSRFYVPVKADQLMRNAITKEETYQCLTELERLQAERFCSKKPAELAEHYDELLLENDMIDHLTLYQEKLDIIEHEYNIPISNEFREQVCLV